MWLFWLLLVFEFGSIAVCLWALQRLYRYIRKYRFDESVYSLLFGFIHLRYFAFGYVSMTALAVLTGFSFAFSLFSHASST